MTAQIHDHIYYRGDEYAIVGIKGSGLPSPLDFGIIPVMMSTACYRGYFAGYTCTGDMLFLTSLTVRARTNTYPPVDDVHPVIGGAFNAGQYQGLYLPVRFTGGLLIARDFIQSMYIHMGFQKAPAYQTVIELWFENGNLRSAMDYSEKMALIRETLMQPANAAGARVEDVGQWIERMFSLEYEVDL
jgi:hypothetical protein